MSVLLLCTVALRRKDWGGGVGGGGGGAQSRQAVGTESHRRRFYVTLCCLSVWVASINFFLDQPDVISRVRLLTGEDAVGRTGRRPSCPLQGGFSRAFGLDAAVTEPWKEERKFLAGSELNKTHPEMSFPGDKRASSSRLVSKRS